MATSPTNRVKAGKSLLVIENIAILTENNTVARMPARLQE